jgi:O-antigen/teichoic acid export membrane protein
VLPIRKILHNDNVLSLLGNLTVTGFGIASFMLLTRTLSLTMFGQWSLYVSASTLLEMLRSGLTRVALIRFLSGADGKEKQTILGSNWIISIALTFIVAVVLLAIRFAFKSTIDQSSFALFFQWYPLIAFANLPLQNSLSQLQAEQRFSSILYLRAFDSGMFVLVLLINFITLQSGISFIVLAYLLIAVAASVVGTAMTKDGLAAISKARKKTIQELLHFGKYTLGTLIGTNLLKSTDAFIIGMSPVLGAAGVAMFSVPLKMIEMLEIPLRSMVSTAYPKIAAAARHGQKEKVKSTFYAYTGFTMILFVPILLAGTIAAPWFIIILAGPEYLAAAFLFRIFCIYGLFLPFDRFAGVVLDAINKPKLNFIKVTFMALVNLIGDLVAVFVFQSLELVAAATILMTICGVMWGYYYLDREFGLHFRTMMLTGFAKWRNTFSFDHKRPIHESL